MQQYKRATDWNKDTRHTARSASQRSMERLAGSQTHTARHDGT